MRSVMGVKCSGHRYPEGAAGRRRLTHHASFLSEHECAPVSRARCGHWSFRSPSRRRSSSSLTSSVDTSSLSGDNLQQNYPLHVLVGSMLSHGPAARCGTRTSSVAHRYWRASTPGRCHPLVGLFAILPDRLSCGLPPSPSSSSSIGVAGTSSCAPLKLSPKACFLSQPSFSCSVEPFSARSTTST